MRKFTIGANDAGQRVDKFLRKTCPQLPAALLYKAFRKKDVKCNGKPISPQAFLETGDELRVYLPDDCFGGIRTDVPASPKRISTQHLPSPEIVYEDVRFAILRKPVNLPVHRDDRQSHDTLCDRFLQYLCAQGSFIPTQEQSFTPALCNRLDRNTEGMVLGAKTAEALRTLHAHIRDGRVRKEYLCITVGAPPKPIDCVTAYHMRLPNGLVSLSDTPKDGYREIRTGYRVLEKRGDLTLVLVTLHTGRTHQIRAQMAALGCPILGDPKYGNLRYNRHADVSHQLLAACRLQFADLPPQDLFADLNGHIWYYVPAFCTQYGFGVARINALLAGKAIRDGKG